jgi:hypothetical protein
VESEVTFTNKFEGYLEHVSLIVLLCNITSWDLAGSWFFKSPHA